MPIAMNARFQMNVALEGQTFLKKFPLDFYSVAETVFNKKNKIF